MAEPLKNHFDERVPRTIAAQIRAVWPAFRTRQFLSAVASGYDELGLMDRGRHVARALHVHLPNDYPDALAILLESIGERPVRSEGDGGMASFLYLPHVQFVEKYGLEHFELSMQALYQLTQRFTGEFSIRPFLERYEADSLALLHVWAGDADMHVRRLVSEGTRTRLPWAGRLRRFQQDPSPVLELLERLRDDPEEYVRRSVANNLNDIGKDHPQLLVDVARRWMVDADDRRRALVRHALRMLVKQGHPGALELLGYGETAKVVMKHASIQPARAKLGTAVAISFELHSTTRTEQRLLVDLRVHYAKANGRTSPKVFKLRTVDVEAGGTVAFQKRLSLADLTTRKHYRGRHRVEALVNGATVEVGEFVAV